MKEAKSILLLVSLITLAYANPNGDAKTTLISNATIQITDADYSPYLDHWIDEFSQENVIKLEDGSQWIFDSMHLTRLDDWKPGDTVVIAPQDSIWFWSSNYAYLLTNKDTGSSLEANLFIEPTDHGSYSIWVKGINYSLGHVHLRNGQGEETVWEISNADAQLFKDWDRNDLIIVAENPSWIWWFSSFKDTLINVKRGHYVRARPLSITTAGEDIMYQEP